MDAHDSSWEFEISDADVRVAVARVLDEVEEFARLCPDLPSKLCLRLGLLVEELVVNSFLHGSGGQTPWVRVLLHWNGQGVALDYWDRGVEFDPTRDVLGGVTEGDCHGGVGWCLIRYYGSGIHYRREDGINHISLRIPG